MTNNYYALAHEQAAGERAEVRAQLEQLTARDGKLEKLVEALQALLPQAAPVEAHGEEHPPEHHEAAPEHHG